MVSTSLEADDLVRMVAAAFGLPQENSKAVLLNRIEQFLLACHRQGKRALLMVDEAQNLPARSVEELRMLSNFVYAGKPLLQTFLLGQPEFRRTLQRPDMEQLQAAGDRLLPPGADGRSGDRGLHRAPAADRRLARVTHRSARTRSLPSISIPAAFRARSTSCATACC